MKTISMLFKLALIFLSSWAFAQNTPNPILSKIKTGDSFIQELAFLDARGREVFVARKVTNTGVAEITDNGKTFTYQNGTVTKFDGNYEVASKN